MKRQLSIPTLATLLFAGLTALGAATLLPLLTRFAREAAVGEWNFIVAPGLLAGLWAMLIYRRAATKVKHISQSLSRGVLVAVLTWLSFSAAVTWVWCVPDLYYECFRHALMISGVLAGGQLLIAALAAAAIVGYAIRARAPRGGG